MVQPLSDSPELADRRVLVIEDDATVSEIVRTYLQAASYIVDIARDSFAGLAAVSAGAPDLVVLDRMLPGIDGAEVCRRIRADSSVPIIMLTALGSEDDRIDGLEAGADDYVVKPFSPKELVLRVNSALRRSLPEFAREAPFQIGPFHLDPSARIATKHGAPLELSVREFDLFAFLLKHPRQTFDRPTLLRSVWGWEIGDLSTVTVTTRRLREKIEEDPGNPTVLVTVWGVGYRLELGSV
ncbi:MULTISPECIES: response regulator transcription factor [unclassified Microbacterium]|uniref:response regulator transcription factor n=1 Tax=unclassified Microbacterium TaxID=2609290 RepID=UPI000CFE2645|nr:MULTISPECIES: response regulator transcription factor [unclassified Microbacterium]PQZ61387.1 DNA-binding response regulator [Microbacterium sp. MYb43]PQZ82598.1 DNA-binding response regulator [Microbacterium sp. MYb40]PRB23702.1 DNA-binding response regulator [Microbacterium sp. MYb54]PRB29597.1 DNA-binding response regulator [Microbacterium sp. MYb50]PRB71045.1 DNA-binding response regulator [Microbacterium sp. MYb24]